MITIAEILNGEPYSLNKEKKQKVFTSVLSALTCHHYEKCLPYRRILDASSFDFNKIKSYYDIPFIPSSLFKEFDLLSVDKTGVVKTLTSSGTTGQAVSRIFLDKETAANQQKTLVKIVSSFIGPNRLPLIILDSSAVIEERNMLSARGAGILGFSIFGSEKVYAFNQDMQLDISALAAFLEKHREENILLFGFTFIVWRHFYKELIRAGFQPNLSKGILFHGGGWKKLRDEAVSPAEFKDGLCKACGLKRVHNYYGIIEQAGSIFVECEQGYLHAPITSEIITRRHIDFSPAPFGESGVIELLSILPGSYPGHALLTEDEGIISGEDNCLCGRHGKYFKVTGRLKNAQIRGCSDTYVNKLG